MFPAFLFHSLSFLLRSSFFPRTVVSPPTPYLCFFLSFLVTISLFSLTLCSSCFLAPSFLSHSLALCIPPFHFSFLPRRFRSFSFSFRISTWPYFYPLLANNLFSFVIGFTNLPISSSHRFLPPSYWSPSRLSHQIRVLRLPGVAFVSWITWTPYGIFSLAGGKIERSYLFSRSWHTTVPFSLPRNSFVRSTKPYILVKLYRIEIVWRPEVSCNFLLASNQVFGPR